MRQPLYAIYGAGGCGRGILPLARSTIEKINIPIDRLVFVDDAITSNMINGHAVLSSEEFLAAEASKKFAVLAIANGYIRKKLVDRLFNEGIKLWSVKAENIMIMDNVVIGEGSVLSPFVCLTSNINIGNCFHANLYSYVEHDCVIGDFVTFAPGAKCNGNVLIEDHAYIGSGAVIKQGKPNQPLIIGQGAVVGMGAVVTKDVPAGVTVVGNPARVL